MKRWLIKLKTPKNITEYREIPADSREEAKNKMLAKKPTTWRIISTGEALPTGEVKDVKKS